MTLIEPTPAQPEHQQRHTTISWKLVGTPEQKAEQLLELSAQNTPSLSVSFSYSAPSNKWRRAQRAGWVSILLAVVLGGVASAGLFLVNQEAASSGSPFEFQTVMFGLLVGLSVGLFGATLWELRRQRRAERERMLARARRAQSARDLMNRLQHATMREVKEKLGGRDA